MANAKIVHAPYKTRNDMPESTRMKMAELLNRSLAATFDMYSQVKQAHWNVKGKDFYQLHEIFDEIAGEFDEWVDMVAERVTTLGGYAHGTVRMAANNTFLPEYPVDAVQGKDHLIALADRLALYGKHVREAIDTAANLGDADTADLYTEISRDVDKRLWFIEAHLVD